MAAELKFLPPLSQGSWALLPTGCSGHLGGDTQWGWAWHSWQGRGWRERGGLGPGALLTLIRTPPALGGQECMAPAWAQGIKASDPDQTVTSQQKAGGGGPRWQMRSASCPPLPLGFSPAMPCPQLGMPGVSRMSFVCPAALSECRLPVQ